MLTFRLVVIAAESSMLAAVRDAALGCEALQVTSFQAHDLRQRIGELVAALSEADACIASMVNVEQETAALVEALSHARPRIVLAFNCQPDLIRFARMGPLDGERLTDPVELKQLAAAFRAAGTPLPPMANVILAALPRLLPMLPDEAVFHQLRPYGAAAQYWLQPSPGNLRLLLDYLRRFAADPLAEATAASSQPALALWHPASDRLFTDLASYQAWYAAYLLERYGTSVNRPYVGLIFFRQLVLSGDTAHYAAVIEGLEAQGLAVVGGFGGLDNTPLVERFLVPSNIEILINLTGFNLVGSMGRPDPDRAVALLKTLGVPYFVCGPLLFQTVDQWREDPMGLAPTQAALQIVMPELEGGIEPRVIGGAGSTDRLQPLGQHVETLVRRARRWIALRRKAASERKVAITIFSFPPDKGALGTAAYLDVFASLHGLLSELKGQGYHVGDLPPDPESLLHQVLGGDQKQTFIAAVPPVDSISTLRYKGLVPYADRIEPLFGPAPGTLDTDGEGILIRGRLFGNVFVGIQPSFGYEGDPMRLLFDPDASPSHSFAAYYAWIDQVWGADAQIHFGTHGALEFMPGKQVGLTPECFPDLLMSDTPHLYFYSINNPSEATIAKRRSGAVIASYLSPPLAAAGLYRNLITLREAIDSWHRADEKDRDFGYVVECAKAAHFDPVLERHHVVDAVPTSLDATVQAACIDDLREQLVEVEQRLIPIGLHISGRPLSAEARGSFMLAEARVGRPESRLTPLPEVLGKSDDATQTAEALVKAYITASGAGFLGEAQTLLGPERYTQLEAQLSTWVAHFDAYVERLEPLGELPALLRGLGGGYIPPSPGGDPIREAAVLPSGRNIHALDPYRVPSPTASRNAKRTMEKLIQRLKDDLGEYPESLAMVLWGTDNIKTHGEGVAQALAALGVEVQPDSLGRMTRLHLIPLAELGRPRIDVVMTLSGIFRDIFPSVIDLLDRAVRLAAEADEPLDHNFVRRKTLRLAKELGLDQAHAAARLFSNQSGMYGTGVNHVVDASDWDDRGELVDLFLTRKSYVFGDHSRGEKDQDLFEAALTGVAATFQNLDSAEIGLTDVDHYFEYLGGLTAAVAAKNGDERPAFVVDPLEDEGAIRTLDEALRLETRTKLLNPRWYEALLAHGFQGVNEIASRLDHVFGWSATTDAVDGWIYEEAADAFVLDDAMRERLLNQNPMGVRRMVERMLEAEQRGFWTPDAARSRQLQDVYDALLDTAEGLGVVVRPKP